MSSKIEWTDESWNPAVGCTPVSAGCKNCWAGKFAARQEAKGTEKYVGTTLHGKFHGIIKCDRKSLEKPLHWKKPRMVAVCLMGDLFHKAVPFEFITRTVQVIAECPQHTFQLVTKRPEHAARWFREWWRPDVRNYFKRGGYRYLRPRLFLRRPGCSECRYFFLGCLHGRKKWQDEAVTPNYRTCEHQCYFGDEEYICDNFKWHKDSVGHGVAVVMNNGEISVREEDCVGGFPGPLKNVWLGTSVENQETADERIPHLLNCPAAVRFLSIEPMLGPLPDLNLDGIHWVIVGGESGPGARPMSVDWALSIREHCRVWGVPFFMKQMGSAWARANGFRGKGNNMADWPADLRIRQMPETAKRKE